MSFHAYHSMLFAFGKKFFFKVFIFHYETYVHFAAVFLVNCSFKKGQCIDGIVKQLCFLVINFFYCCYSALLFQPLKCKQANIYRKYWWRIEHGASLNMIA